MSPELLRRVAELFPDDADEIGARLEAECGPNLARFAKQGENGLERLRASVLKLSEGRLDKFDQALAIARRDWRDAMVWAGFGHDAFAHRAWLGQTDS